MADSDVTDDCGYGCSGRNHPANRAGMLSVHHIAGFLAPAFPNLGRCSGLNANDYLFDLAQKRKVGLGKGADDNNRVPNRIRLQIPHRTMPYRFPTVRSKWTTTKRGIASNDQTKSSCSRYAAHAKSMIGRPVEDFKRGCPRRSHTCRPESASMRFHIPAFAGIWDVFLSIVGVTKKGCIFERFTEICVVFLCPCVIPMRTPPRLAVESGCLAICSPSDHNHPPKHKKVGVVFGWIHYSESPLDF